EPRLHARCRALGREPDRDERGRLRHEVRRPSARAMCWRASVRSTVPTCFLVLGTPRSGTSCVAGLLHRVGVMMGHRLMEADGMNPTGFYQDIDFEELFDGLLDVFPQEWPFCLPGDRLGRMAELIRRREALGVHWGFKSPRTAYVLPQVLPLM